MKYNLQKIKEVMLKKGYKFFEQGTYNLNIIGVRSEDSTPDKFNDELYLIYKDEFERWYIHCFPCTTDPGLYYLKNPLSSKGTAILVPGQYSGMWMLGKHQGKYDALVQAKPVKVYRDNDRDNEFDYNPFSIDEGVFGINLHKANENAVSTTVGKWSAGCQVVQNPKYFDFIISICRKAEKIYGNSFSYTLLETKDF